MGGIPPLSPNTGFNKNSTAKEIPRGGIPVEEPEENIMFLGSNHYGGIPSGPSNRRVDSINTH
jgi:hypothetical protein